jgi:membrane protease YdiL (CAAX protease family)
MFSADSENPWIADVRAAPRLARPIQTLALATIICAAIVAGAVSWGRGAATALAGKATGPIASTGTELADLMVGTLAAVLMLLATQLAMLAQQRRLWRREPYGWEALFGGLAFGFGGSCAAAAVANLAGAVGVGQASGALGLIGPLLAALAGLGCQALAQEAFFRGWLQPVLCARWGSWPGLIAAAVVFAAFHVALGAHGAITALNLLLFGMLLGLLALRSGGLVAPISAHFAWWGAQDLIFGPGGRPPGALGLNLQGPAWWSGGVNSMNGSLAMTVVMAILLTTLAGARPRRSTAAA